MNQILDTNASLVASISIEVEEFAISLTDVMVMLGAEQEIDGYRLPLCSWTGE